MIYKGKRVLVTGAAGFIGSHLCDGLLSAGATVVGVDNLLTGSEKNLESARSHPEFRFIKADESHSPETYLPEGTRFDVIFHFASPASPPLYEKYPVETYLINSLGTYNLLQYLIATNQEARFIFTSTSEIYCDPKEHPQKETYWGNTNSKDGRVIPNFITQVLGNQPLTIYCNGKQTRSLCYITDLVESISTIDSSDTIKGETFNLGNPAEMTVVEIANMIKTVSGASSSLVYTPLSEDDPTQRKPDITKINKVLGWEPKITPKDGLSQTLTYFKNVMYYQ